MFDALTALGAARVSLAGALSHSRPFSAWEEGVSLPDPSAVPTMGPDAVARTLRQLASLTRRDRHRPPSWRGSVALWRAHARAVDAALAPSHRLAA